jgi:tartrate dehydratase beta subunit/fumarate hydratase class I family protein
VVDFPLTVILDAHGGDLYESGPAAYLSQGSAATESEDHQT